MGSTRNRGGGLDLAGAFSKFSPAQEDEETRRKLEEMLRGQQQSGRRGLFGNGFADKLGDLGTALMAAQAGIDGDFGTSAALSSSIGAARKKAAEDARKRQEGREDFLWQQKNRAPSPNDTERDYNLILERYGQKAADQWMMNRIDPVVNIPLPGGATYMGPRSAMPGALGGSQMEPSRSGPPAAAVEALRANPALKDDFDRKYGSGASSRYLGGGVGNGAGNFRRR
jgi:hypothetical protein